MESPNLALIKANTYHKIATLTNITCLLESLECAPLRKVGWNVGPTPRGNCQNLEVKFKNEFFD